MTASYDPIDELLDPVNQLIDEHIEELAARKAFPLSARRIIYVLYVANKPLTTNKVAEYAEISRPTARVYLRKLYKRGVVDGGRYKKGVYWWIKNAYVANVVVRITEPPKKKEHKKKITV